MIQCHSLVKDKLRRLRYGYARQLESEQPQFLYTAKMDLSFELPYDNNHFAKVYCLDQDSSFVRIDTFYSVLIKNNNDLKHKQSQVRRRVLVLRNKGIERYLDKLTQIIEMNEETINVINFLLKRYGT